MLRLTMKTQADLQKITRWLAWSTLVIVVLYLMMAITISYRRIDRLEGYVPSSAAYVTNELIKTIKMPSGAT